MGKARKALIISVTGLMALTAAVLVSPGTASAATRPPTDHSYYVAPGDTNSTAQSLGCAQAESDNSDDADSFVTLDFGAQRADGAGTYLPSSTVFWSNATDEDYSLRFAYGYQQCSPRHLLLLAIGTSNDGSVTDGALGADWGTAVQYVAVTASDSGYPNVAIQGAVDAEPGFGPFAHFEGWELGDESGGGYVSTTKALISDFGSADGCPQNIGTYSDALCSNGWYLSSEYDAVWGWAPNEGTPEIYFNGCMDYAEQANQWANVSDYGAHYGSQGQVSFVGPLDQDDCLSPSGAWSDFQTALDQDGVSDSMRFSTQMVTK
jgi:hypothetical protein